MLYATQLQLTIEVTGSQIQETCEHGNLRAMGAGRAGQWQVKIILQVKSSNQEVHAQLFCRRSGLPKTEFGQRRIPEITVHVN